MQMRKSPNNDFGFTLLDVIPIEEWAADSCIVLDTQALTNLFFSISG